ncbi:hypothetical protein [Actinomadura mexicana]|uniref:hypothetical protein n=1 Tax=Actinomadura mexicana TaxID=134959 RepID=UPI000B771643|nr:hypothetical protein [Actinomadura mexicana]
MFDFLAPPGGGVLAGHAEAFGERVLDRDRRAAVADLLCFGVEIAVFAWGVGPDAPEVQKRWRAWYPVTSSAAA